MKFRLHFMLLTFAFVLYSTFTHSSGCKKYKRNNYVLIDEPGAKEKSRILQKALLAKEFVKEKKFNDQLCFLIDMDVPSGKKRFFVYDLKKDSIIACGMVAHGHCRTPFLVKAQFTNSKQSCCTALGKYKIGERYNGQFGQAYTLYGLDVSNSNAYARNIVLHSYSCVPENETGPFPICNSSGCPMLSPTFLKTIQSYLDSTRRPVLLWIFN